MKKISQVKLLNIDINVDFSDTIPSVLAVLLMGV